jgi:hypothetical protein
MRISKIAQFNNFEDQNEDPDFDLDFDPNIPNPMLDQVYQNVTQEMMLRKITQIKTSACDTVYDVNGTKVILWIISGGTPALGLIENVNDCGYNYTKRYPIVPQWSSDKWMNHKDRYEHQDPNNIQGPTYDILPNGAQDLIDFVNEHKPKMQLRQTRYAMLPVHGRFYGKKALNRFYRSFSRPYIKLSRDNCFIDVPKPAAYPPWWGIMLRFFQDNNTDSTGEPKYISLQYEDLSEPAFAEFIQLLHDGITLGILQPRNS